MAGRLARSEQRTNALQIENASLRKQVRELTDALTDVTHQTNVRNDVLPTSRIY